MAIDREKIEYHVREILKALGEDPDREGLIETPERVARMYEEVYEGYQRFQLLRASHGADVRHDGKCGIYP